MKLKQTVCVSYKLVNQQVMSRPLLQNSTSVIYTLTVTGSFVILYLPYSSVSVSNQVMAFHPTQLSLCCMYCVFQVYFR